MKPVRGLLVFLLALSVLSLAAFGDTGGSASASIIIVPPPGPRITLTPDRATNAVGEPHVLTVHLEISEGLGWNDVAGETIEIRIISGIGWLSAGPYVTDSNGEVRVTLNAAEPGLIVVEASWTGIIEAETVSASDIAEKEYIDVGARLMLEPDGTNVVGDAHVFTAHLEIYEGKEVGWADGAGEPIDIVIVSGPGWLSPGSYVTDENGEVEVTHETDTRGVTVVQATWNGVVVERAVTASDTAEKTWEQGPPGGGGGGDVIDCRGRCPPPIPALYATKRSELAVDVNGNNEIDAGDVIRYTMLVTNFATVPMEGVQYVEILDPNARLVEDSWETNRGNLMARDLEGTEVLVGSIGSILPDEIVLLSYDMLVREDLAPSVNYLVSQGTVYADTTSPVVTDDPLTQPIHDATLTWIGPATGGGGSLFEEGSPAFLKEAYALKPDVLRVVAPGNSVDYLVGYTNDTGSRLTDVRLVDVVGPFFLVQTYLSTGGDVNVWPVGQMQFIVADFAELGPGERAEVTYRAQAQLHVPLEVSHTAIRGLAACSGTVSQLTDDPLTELRGDATCVLFPYRCDFRGEVRDGWTWDDWRDVVSKAPTSLFPLVMKEKDGTEHVRWVLYGADFFGDLSVEPSTRPSNWSQWALVGLVELAFEDLLTADPGFRLAQREEPYVEAFLAEEPFFMWQDYDVPLYGRVPAADAGELLHCDGIVRELCDRAYLPLLVELDWSRDWNMRWLEDDLIVATVIQETRQR